MWNDASLWSHGGQASFLILTIASLMIYSEQKHTVFFTGPFGYSFANWQSSGLPKCLPTQETQERSEFDSWIGKIPWRRKYPEGDNPFQYCLENSTDRAAWQATVHGVTKSWTWLSNWARTVLSVVSSVGTIFNCCPKNTGFRKILKYLVMQLIAISSLDL